MIVRFRFILGLSLLAVLSIDNAVQAQNCSVFLVKSVAGSSTVRGTITEMSPKGVTVKSNEKTLEVAASNIKKISFADEPAALERARDRLESERYGDCLTELQKIEEPPTEPLIVHEIEFLRACSMAQIALQGGDVTAKDGGSEIKKFMNQHPDSYHTIPVTELLGQLLLAIGRMDLAEAEFAKLAGSDWPEFQLLGYFRRGEAQLLQNKAKEAEQSFAAILGLDANDQTAQQYKLLARCQQAKATALCGEPDAALAVVEKIIQEENPDNMQLFAYAYNAKGICHLQSDQIKDAALAFLFTELLCSTAREPHAEALYYLTQIWPKLEDTDRTNRAKEALKSRYRNSFWASKL